MECRVRSAEIKHITTLELRWKPVQEFCDGRGKSELNHVRKSVSEVQCHVGLLPKDLEGTSEIAFHFPSMCSAIRGQVLFDLSLKASAWTRCSATMNFSEAKRVTHDTVGKLSPNSAARFSCSGWQTFSITSQSRRMPAISKSELVMPPVGLEA